MLSIERGLASLLIEKEAEFQDLDQDLNIAKSSPK